MAFWNKLFGGTEVKESAVSSALLLSSGQAVWSNRDYGAFAKEAFSQNVIGYQSVSKIAEAVASVRFGVWSGEREVESHPLAPLLRRPNMSQSWSQFIGEAIGYFMISGNMYLERIDAGARPRELYAHRPDRMKVIPGPQGVVAYEYKVNGRTVRWDVDPLNGTGQLKHVKTFNPLDDWYGLAPTEAAAYGVDQHNAAMSWMKALLDNSARPSGALVSKGTLGDEQFHQLKTEIEQNYSGHKNAGRPLLFEGDMEWVEMGMSPSDMGIVDVKNSAARDIALAYGVPPQLLGIPGDNTYSNYQQARLAFWEDTVIPIVQTVQDELSNWLQADIRPDMDQIPAIVEKRMQLWEMADNSPDLTINESRVLKGFPELPDERGDMLKGELRVPQQQEQKSINDILGQLAYGQ